MTSSHHRRLLWRKKEQERTVENDQIPLMMQEDDTTTSSGLESKFAEFDSILKSDQWSMAAGTSRDNDEYMNEDSDVDDRDEGSHLSDLQRELEAAELGAAVPSSFREHHEEEEREDLVVGDPEKVIDTQSVVSSSTTDSFDVEVAIEKIKIQKKAMMEQANQDGTETEEQNIRFAQFVAQMEHDFDGAILAMMEAHAETTSIESDWAQVVEEEVRQPELEDTIEYHEPDELPRIYPIMETVEEEPVLETHLEIYDDESSDEDAYFTPVSVPDVPSDESQAFSSSQSDNRAQERALHYYNSPESVGFISPLTDYGYNPYQEKQEPSSFEPCIDLDQFAADSVRAEENRELEAALEEQHTMEASQHVAQHHVALQVGADDGYSCDDDYDNYYEDDENQYWGLVQKSKYPVASASFICLILVLIQLFAFRELLSLLLDYHQSTTNLLDPTRGSFPLCKADYGCQSAIPVALSKSGEHRIFASTTTVESTNEIQNDGCGESWIQSPALWYSIIGDGSKHTAIAFPTPDNFDVSIMVLEGRCNQSEFHYGPSQCCGQDGESSLVWDTVKGKEYFIAVFGAQQNSTGSFRMTLWNIQHTKEALMDHVEQRGINSFQDLAVGGSAGISTAFLATVIALA